MLYEMYYIYIVTCVCTSVGQSSSSVSWCSLMHYGMQCEEHRRERQEHLAGDRGRAVAAFACGARRVSLRPRLRLRRGALQLHLGAF